MSNCITIGKFSGEQISCESRQSFKEIKLCDRAIVVVALVNKFGWPKVADSDRAFIAYLGFESVEEARQLLQRVIHDHAEIRAAERIEDWPFEAKIKGISADWVLKFVEDNPDF